MAGSPFSRSARTIFECGGNPGDAVEATAAGTVSLCEPNAMTPSAGSALEPTYQVAGRIDAGGQAGLGEAPRETGAAFEEKRRERAPGIGPLGSVISASAMTSAHRRSHRAADWCMPGQLRLRSVHR